MNHHPKRPPTAAPTAPTPRVADHLKRDCVIELDYLDVGRRVFVATDENGWLIAQGMALSDVEAERVLTRLHDALEAHRLRPRPTLLL